MTQDLTPPPPPPPPAKKNRKRNDEPLDIKVDVEARKQQWQQAGLLSTKVESGNTSSNKTTTKTFTTATTAGHKTLSPEQQERQDEIAARQQLWREAGLASDPEITKSLPSFSEQSPYYQSKTIREKCKHLIWCYQHRPWHERSVLPLRIVTGSISAWYVVTMIEKIVEGDKYGAVGMMLFFPAIIALFMLNFLKLK